MSLAAAVLYGVSWDNDGGRAKGEDGVDLALLIVFLAVPLGLAAVYALSMCYLRCFFGCLCDSIFRPMAERWEEQHNAAKRDLRAARRRAQV